MLARKVHIKELRSDLSFFFCIFAENIFHLACSSRRFAHCIANVRYVYGDYQFLLHQHRKDMAGWSAMFSSTSLTLQLEEKGRQPKSVVRLSGLGQCLQLGRREAGRRGEASWHSRPPAPQSRSPWPHGGYFLDFQDFSSYVQSDKPSCWNLREDP